MTDLRDLDFGAVAAEQEDRLSEWFIETDEFRRIRRGDINFILGVKGSGKSSMFKMLPQIESENLLIVPATSLQGSAEYEMIFSSMQNDTSYFRLSWRIYGSILIGQRIIDKYTDIEQDNEDFKIIKNILESANLTKRSVLKDFYYTIREKMSEIEINTEHVLFKMKSGQRKFNYSRLLEAEEAFLKNRNIKCWVLFDRLDEFFTTDLQKRKMALEGLLFANSDIGNLSCIDFKIFLRTDVFDTLEFENKDHLSSSIVKIDWKVDDLLMLISKRLAKNRDIVSDAMGIKQEVEVNYRVAEILFNTVFENTVEKGQRQATSLKWIYTRLLNGQNISTPRDMIYFCCEAKNNQIKFGYPLETGRLISGRAIKEAFPKFSEHKLKDYIYSVFPDTKDLIEKFRGSERPKFSLERLKDMLRNGNDVLTKIRKLYETGFLRKIGNRPVENTEFFEIPLMYRPVLGIKTFGPKKRAS